MFDPVRDTTLLRLVLAQCITPIGIGIGTCTPITDGCGSPWTEHPESRQGTRILTHLIDISKKSELPTDQLAGPVVPTTLCQHNV
jgi:hypothetical protein